jgi:N-methylhydantoinase B
MTVVAFGEGRRIATQGAAGAVNVLEDPKLGRIVINRDGTQEEHRKNFITTVQPGQRVANRNPGGGGYGDPMTRPVAEVVADVRDGLVSVAGARAEYGVVLDGATLAVDEAATLALRAAAA